MDGLNEFQMRGRGPRPKGTTHEWWILERWTAKEVMIRNGMGGKSVKVKLSELTGWTIANINKCDIGGAFERIYLNGKG